MSEKVIVFSGPSLAGIDLGGFQSMEFRPPCKQGDVYLAARDCPNAIAIIDGYFEGQPSVWHKEVLYALSEGIHVFGASSMGALRASETHTFGMMGVGAVFEAYRDGDITDDDEVGLIHGPAELGYVPLSEPMVNVRATCSLAVAKNVLSPTSSEHVCNVAKAIFYKTRTWDAVLDQLEAADFHKQKLDQFAVWLTEHALDQKKIDALELLEILEQADLSERFVAEFEFVVTEFWLRCCSTWRQANTTTIEQNDGYRSGGFRLLS